MSNVEYRNDPLAPRTETQRVLDAQRAAAALAVPTIAAPEPLHPATQELVQINSAPIPAPLTIAATVAADKADTRRAITATEAAAIIHDEFEPAVIAPANAHHVAFLTEVADVLDADPNPANLEQIAELLDKAGVELADHEYPKMLYSRGYAPAEFESHVDARNDRIGVVVANEDEAKELGSGWTDDPTTLKPRKVAADGKVAATAEDRGYFEPAPVPEKADKPAASDRVAPDARGPADPLAHH